MQWRGVIAALANETAREVYAQVVIGDTDDLGAHLSPSRRKHALQTLEKAGLIARTDEGWSAPATPFREALSAAPPVARKTGVDRFLTDDGRIARYPTRPDDRAQVLQWTAERVLTPGEVLSERDVNERLSTVTDDVAYLRRALVDAGLLERTVSGSEYILATAE